MKKLHLLKDVLVRTGTHRILISFLAFFFLDALVIWLLDPAIESYGNALWYCCAVVSTAGFGDFAATTAVTRIATVLLMAYSVVAVAIITGVIVNFHSQLIAIRQKDTVSAFVHQLERLPELSREELADLSMRVKRFKN